MKLYHLIQKGLELLGREKFLEVLLILEKISKMRKEEILSSPEFSPTPSMGKEFFKLISKRLKNFPLQYILEKTEFWSMEFKIKRGVFIPRQETELLIEKIVEFATGKKVLIADIGTGCGNIAIALSKELPGADIIATDISSKAIELAEENARIHGVEKRIKFLKGNLFEPLERLGLSKSFDVICSNPPYISLREKNNISKEVLNYEPKKALFSGWDGMSFIRKFMKFSPSFLKNRGRVYFEIGETMEDNVRALLEKWRKKEVYTDLFMKPRIAMAEL